MNINGFDILDRRESGGDWATYLFHQGTNFHAYALLGAHRVGERFLFRTWAPNADNVWVTGDFCNWDHHAIAMTRVTRGGIWEVTLPSDMIREGQFYKYCIRNHGKEQLKADPYAVSMQRPPDTASVIADIEGYTWRDEGWLRYRALHFTRQKASAQPINIYEMHLGSWRRHEDGSYFSYLELASALPAYLKQMGYTHVEWMPIAEHPYDGSWGYQICGYYAPTSRFGTPREFMSLVDALHEAGIGVILDWVPAHFPKDAHGLYEFDGQPLYEYQGADRMEHRGWGTRCFDVGREEVQCFLISNAVYWIEKYHIDGLRVDAVASMLYLDYDKSPGEWLPNANGGRECHEAIAFFQKLNAYLAKEHPDVMTFAEESTAWAHVTDLENGGLGFTYKWNMGWMNDSLAYLCEEPVWRSYHHNRMTFSMTYSFSENFVLPISHDEVVHGKKSLLDRAPGAYAQKFAGTRTYLTYMMTHPGKKLLFMGSELGMFREWDHAQSLEWFLLDYDMHAKHQLFVSELNHFYMEHSPLWEMDDGWDGFRWIDADNAKESVFSYRRIDKKGRELIVVLNFVPVKREKFLLSVPFAGVYEEVFNTDDTRYGGDGCRNTGAKKTVRAPMRGYESAIEIDLPPMSALMFRCTKRAPKSREYRK